MQTHTFVTLEVTAPLYNEVMEKLKAAGYGHCFVQSGEDTLIDMQGIALKKRPKPPLFTGQPDDFKRAQLILEGWYKVRYGLTPEVIRKNSRLAAERELVRWMLARIKDGSLPTT